MDIHAVVIVAIILLVSSHLFSLLYIALSCLTKGNFLQKYPHLYCQKKRDGRCQGHSRWRYFCYFLYVIPMVPQMILFYEASIRSWRRYKAKERKGKSSIRSYIKYNRALKDMEEIEKINKDLKLIENVAETYGQMMFQLIILYRLQTLMADDFHFMGLFVVPFEYYMWITLSI